MGLVYSCRLTDADRAVWKRMARYDARLADAGELDRATELARSRIIEFAARGPCHVACSWGRDSVTVTHLAHGLGLPVVWARENGPIDNPDCPMVRDAYLDRWPIDDYQEIHFPSRPGRYGKPVEYWPYTQAEEDAWGEGHPITGVRADESPNRALSMITHGAGTSRTMRPIIEWPSRLIWAYAARHDLPIHPAYAMTYGGVLSRDRIRVHSLGGDTGRGAGRWEWENTYYPEVLNVRAMNQAWR